METAKFDRNVYNPFEAATPGFYTVLFPNDNFGGVT